MPRTEEANQQIKDERREQIMNAALKVFARKGLKAAKIADIADSIDISQGLIYRYFSSKEEIFAALAEAVMTITVELARNSQAQPGTTWDRLVWLTEHLLPYEYTQPEGALLLLHAVTNESTPPLVRAAVLRHTLEVLAIVAQMIRDGQVAGQIVQREPEQLAFLYLSTLQGLAAGAAFLEGNPARYPDTESILRGFKA